MTCFNIPAQNIPSSEDGAKRRGLASGLVGVASPRSNWLPGLSARPVASSELPPPPCVCQLPFYRPPFFSFTVICRHNSAGMWMCVMCVSWHVITRHFCKSMKLNREEPVPWTFSGWHPTMLLCLISAHTDLMYNISLVLSALHSELEAHRTPENSHPASGSLNLFLKSGRLVTVVRGDCWGLRWGDLAEADGGFAARQSSNVTRQKDGKGKLRVIGAMGY